MTRLQLILLGLAAVSVVAASFVYLQSQSRQETEPFRQTETSFNKYAKIAGSGSPLPTNAREDVVLEQQLLGDPLYTLAYDADNWSWQIEFESQGALQRIRYVDGAYFTYNLADLIWDETDPAILSDDLLALGSDIDDFILTDEQLIEFHRQASEAESILCSNKADLCAVWIADDFINYRQVTFHVNKRNFKIDSVTTTSEDGDSNLVTFYKYRPVAIERPESDQIRFLD